MERSRSNLEAEYNSNSFCSCNLLKYVFWINFIVMVTIVVISTTVCIFLLPPGLNGVLILLLVVLGSLCCWLYCLFSVISCICSIFVFKRKASRKLRRRELPIYYSLNKNNSKSKLQPLHSRQESNNEFCRISESKSMSINDEMPLIKIETKNLSIHNSPTCANCFVVNDCSNEMPCSPLTLPFKDETALCNSTNSRSNALSSVMMPPMHNLVDDNNEVKTDASFQPQLSKELKKKYSFGSRSSEQVCDSVMKLLKNMTDTFGEIHKLLLDSSGLVYHCSQYGVTLIIPEGAVQESTTVWFGACQFSDKFKFGDYVPVTPVVWVHIDRKLDKCAELYIPHDVVISSKDNLQQFTILTAHDGCSDLINFQKNDMSQLQLKSGLQFFKIVSADFCSNCVAVQNRFYQTIPKRYLIARADKKIGSRKLLVQFIFLCQLQGCRKIVENQCDKEGFSIISWKPVTFTGDGQVSLSFEPHNVPGWKREEVGISQDYISVDDIDYYQMMGCENAAEVTEDELERLKMLEELLSYPPRFRMEFISDAIVEKSQKVIVRFNQVHPPVKSTVLLEGSIDLPPTPTPSLSATSIDLISNANDSLLGDCLCIIASEKDIREKWFEFGYQLNLTVGQLHDIEQTSVDLIQRTRKVLIHWRDQNRSESWEPFAEALAKIGFKDLAHRVKDHFESPSALESEPEVKEDHYKGVYCSLCKEYHLKPEDIQQEVPNIDFPPHVVDLTNLVAARIPDKFHLFGTAVRINDGFLRSIYDTYHNPMDRFNAVFNRWKDNDPDTYTWSTVIKVLQSDAIGAYAVAQDVMKHLTAVAKTAEL